MKKPERQIAPEVVDMLFGDYKNPEDWNQIDERLKELKAALIERALAGKKWRA